MPLRILIAPSGLKESLSAKEVAAGIADGVARVLPNAVIHTAPLVDGGEGFAAGLVEATGGRLVSATVTGPLGEPVEAHFGFLGGAGPRTAVLEMAAAAGLRLVPRSARHPSLTTSYGVGELIRAALDAGAERIIVGCGDSGVNDGGCGMAQALGVRLLNRRGEQIGFGGGQLGLLERIDLSGRDPRLNTVPIEVAVNWHNVLLGPRGVARVFGPQKGASPTMVALLERGLERYAAVIRRDLGLDVGDIPGGGASGGLGAGLFALVGARLRPRYEVVMRYLDIDRLLARSDLVLTAEGSVDGQTPWGKVPAEVARRAKGYGLPVIAIAGAVGAEAEACLEHGIDAYFSIARGPCSLEESIANARQLLAGAAEQAIRTVLIGAMVSARRNGASYGEPAPVRAPAPAPPPRVGEHAVSDAL